MKPSSRLMILAVAAGSLTLNGCGNEKYPPYSALVKYGVRHDPILRDAAKELGDERYDPDRPGVFPIMKLDDITKPDNPLYSKSTEIIRYEKSCAIRPSCQPRIAKIWTRPSKATSARRRTRR